MTFVRGGHNDHIHKFTGTQLDTMRQMFEAGHDTRKIAVALGLPESAYQTINRHCKTFGADAKAKRGAAIALKRG